MLWHYVQILGIILTDVELYDAAERNASENSAELSQDKHKNKHTILLLHETLERTHAMIRGYHPSVDHRVEADLNRGHSCIASRPFKSQGSHQAAFPQTKLPAFRFR